MTSFSHDLHPCVISSPLSMTVGFPHDFGVKRFFKLQKGNSKFRMKVLFINPEMNIKYGAYGYQAGLAALSASCKADGVSTIGYRHLVSPFSPTMLDETIREWEPDLIGFYTPFMQYRFVHRLIATIPVQIFTILGGPHPTIFPECLELIPNLDAICIGEGDETFVELIRALSRGKTPEKIAGLAYRQGGEVIFSERRPFIENLDTLPFEDRTIFETARKRRSGLLQISHTNSFRLGRGCPYRCTFCSNSAQSKAQPGKYVRFRSLDHILEEIRTVVKRYRPEVLYFQDDTFMANEGTLIDFCARYKKEIDLPFEFFGRIDRVNDALMKQLRWAGGRRVSFGIESGDEQFREEVLGKRFSNEQVAQAFQITKKHGITAEAFVMIGLPEETRSSARKTAGLLAQIQPDLYTLSTYFPNPGTRLYEISQQKNLLRYPQVPLWVVNQRDVMLHLPYFKPAQVTSERRWFAFRVYGRTSLLKAVLFTMYETDWGEPFLNFFSFLRKPLRKLLLSLGRNARSGGSSPKKVVDVDAKRAG